MKRDVESVMRRGKNIMVNTSIMNDKMEQRLLKKKKLFLFSPIDLEVAECLAKKMLSMPDDTDFIELWIKSEGGNVEDGFALIDVMESVPYVIKTVAVGYVCSMSTLIFSAGKKGHRYMAPRASLMLHQISWGAQGSMKQMQIRQNQTHYLQELYINSLVKYSNKNAKFWKDNITTEEKWFSPEEAVKLGIADNIRLPK